MTMELEPKEASEALRNWAKAEISSASDVRFEISKFLFGTSSASLGFVAAAWKGFHPNEEPQGLVLCSLLLLAASVAWAVYVFWPVIRRNRADADIQKQHKDLVERIMREGAIWLALWSLGIAIGLWTVLKVRASG